MSCDVIILAAGSSQRLGRPKQLLYFQGNTLVGHMVEIATQSDADKVLLLLGANRELVEAQVPKLEKLQVVYNEGWPEGMASSIRKAIAYLETRNANPGAALFMTTDQPHVSKMLLNKIIEIHKDYPEFIIASAYQGIIGIPALFPASFFGELKKLVGDSGARKILMARQEQIKTVEFPGGHIDIDTETDYKNLLSANFHLK